MIPLQSLGIGSIILLAIGLTLTPLLWPLDIHHTFSQHVARKRSSIVYYVVLFSLFLPLFLLFFMGWFIPHFHLPFYTTLLVLIVAVTQYACTFIPETTGWKRTWHRSLAAGSAFALIPLVLSLIAIPNTSLRIVVIICAVAMVLLSIIFLNPRFSRIGESFYIQALYYTAFFLPVLLATYTS
jgi:hypothetical protein